MDTFDLGYFCTTQPVTATNEQEAIALKNARWAAACKLNIEYNLTLIAEQLGVDPARPGYVSTYGPKRRFNAGDNEIDWDGYGGFTTAMAGNKRVFSSHGCECFIIPGEWLKTLLEFYPAACEKKSELSQKRQASRFYSILQQL